MNNHQITRGFGLLERILSKKRINLAKKLINFHQKSGKILDIGCGSYPLLLKNTQFDVKIGIDKGIKDNNCTHKKLRLLNLNICSCEEFPFPNDNFDVITLLAVIEHLSLRQTLRLFKKCYSLLKEDGLFILTTPAKWSDYLLKFMSKIYVVSPEEIREHQTQFNHGLICELLTKANFNRNKIDVGYFEFFLNIWAFAKK